MFRPNSKSEKTLQAKTVFHVFLLSMFSIFFISSCAVEAAKDAEKNVSENDKVQAQNLSDKVNLTEAEPKAKIEIQANSPADIVRSFYAKLREGKFREAMFLTNLRPAIEGLTEAELKDLQVDFNSLAGQVPANLEINGEITVGEKATVTANLPDEATGEKKLQKLNLRLDGNRWILLIIDEADEKVVQKEGKNYFFALRLNVRHEEAKEMLNRIAKAQMVYAAQNGDIFADMQTLIDNNLLPADIKNADSVGYKYDIYLLDDRGKYRVSAVPTIYGKSGKLSFGFESDGKKFPLVKSADNGGKPFNFK